MKNTYFIYYKKKIYIKNNQLYETVKNEKN